MNVTRVPETVGELVTNDPVVAVADMSMADAAELMDFYRVSGLPVIDWNGSLVGVISRSDLLNARQAGAAWHIWPGLAVRHLMTRPAVTVKSSGAIEEAGRLMERLHIDRLVVIDADGGSPIGIVSLTELRMDG